MIERLIQTLRALAAPAESQLERFPNFALGDDELARDFADALLLVSDCPQIRLSADERRALERLDAQLDAMSGAARRRLWSEAAVRTAPEWTTTRRLAREALGALHVPDALSPPNETGSSRGTAG